ncbi:hypothetical protein ACFSKW_50105 [Nonomuraea mangrovi]|uniref:NACHT N-terminal Helical domain-containing protein n=1 Tax=Nonomuraea mangrovi TaxID=2316207 RepID=A0ABW4TF60_9ACTN
MSRESRFGDAVRLLGGPDPSLKTLSTLLSLGTLGIWDLIDVKNELVRLGSDLLVQWRDKRSEREWQSRTDRIEAAHTIVVVTSFFEAMDDLNTHLSNKELRSIKAAWEPLRANRIRAIERHTNTTLNDLKSPICPSPQHPYEVTKENIRQYYHKFSRQLLCFVRGLGALEAAEVS